MRDQISDFKAWLYRNQLWLERHPKAHWFVIILYATTTIMLTGFGIFIVYDNLAKAVVFCLVIAALISLATIDLYHVTMIKSNRFELEQRKRLISELVSIEKNVYKVKFRRELFDIEPDGDAIYTREMILEYDNVDVAWAEMLFGSTNSFGSDFDSMILNAYTYPETKYPLSRVPIEVTKSRMRFAIILRNKLTSLHRLEGFQLNMKWLGAWEALMDNYTDDGILRIDYETSECILELRLPVGYSFKDFRMPRTNSEPVFGKSDDGRIYVTYRLKDLTKGEAFSYFVDIKKEETGSLK